MAVDGAGRFDDSAAAGAGAAVVVVADCAVGAWLPSDLRFCAADMCELPTQQGPWAVDDAHQHAERARAPPSLAAGRRWGKPPQRNAMAQAAQRVQLEPATDAQQQW